MNNHTTGKQYREYVEQEYHEFFALSACCKHVELKIDRDAESWIVFRKNLRLCCDCSVKMAGDVAQEMAAEAQCS